MINGNDTMFFYKGERKTHKSLVCVRANFYYYVLTTEENWNMNSCTNNPYSIQVDNPETKLKLFNRTQKVKNKKNKR